MVQSGAWRLAPGQLAPDPLRAKARGRLQRRVVQRQPDLQVAVPRTHGRELAAAVECDATLAGVRADVRPQGVDLGRDAW